MAVIYASGTNVNRINKVIQMKVGQEQLKPAFNFSKQNLLIE